MEKTLNNGIKMPVLGLGVFKSGRDTYNSVRTALDLGYRHIDTAMIYENEKDVGRALKDSGVPREEVFITTKLWTDDMRSRSTRKAAETSLRLLGTDYADLYLIHWPVKEEMVRSYAEMEELYAEGKFRAIGLSNFLPHHIQVILDECDIVPAVDQLESHPYLNANDVKEFCERQGIVFESWSPLARGKALNDKTLKELASKYGKTVAQTVIRWHIDRGCIVIPKSVTPERIKENFDVFDFALTAKEVALVNSLDKGLRTGSHPDTFNF